MMIPIALGVARQLRLESPANCAWSRPPIALGVARTSFSPHISMKESIVRFERGPRFKKYTAYVLNRQTRKTRKIHFGDNRYQQYKDRTPNKLYTRKNHGNRKRMRRYFTRHSGKGTRAGAITKEKRKSGGMYTPKLLSHIYLW